MSKLRDKIEALINGLGLTSTRFADVIDVKRPIISHILSGRNKPSLDIIQKIVDRFPELEYNWIGEDQELDPMIIQEIKDNNDFGGSSRESNNSHQSPDDSEISDSQGEQKTGKSVERIVMFYSDGSFKAYQPDMFGF